MVPLPTHLRVGDGRGGTHTAGRFHALETVERGAYTALLTAAGFIIVTLLRFAERGDRRAGRPRG